MGLMFDDENELRCPKCGGAVFFEREEYMLDKKVTEIDTAYVETQRSYAIRCANCNELIDTNMAPKIQKL